MNLEKLAERAAVNMPMALKDYRNCEDHSAQGYSTKTGRNPEGLHQSTNGLWLVLWKGKFACIINSKVEIAAIVHFDDDGNLIGPSDNWDSVRDLHRTHANHGHD